MSALRWRQERRVMGEHHKASFTPESTSSHVLEMSGSCTRKRFLLPVCVFPLIDSKLEYNDDDMQTAGV
jgi:hypothetical protein